MYSIVTRQKFSNFGYFRNKSHEHEQNEKSYSPLPIFYGLIHAHIIELRLLPNQLFFSSSTFHKFVQLLLLLLRNEKIVSSFNF